MPETNYVQFRIYCSCFLITLFFSFNLRISAQTAWPSEAWSAAENLSTVMDPSGVVDLSGLFYNSNTKRLYGCMDNGSVRVLQLNTITNTFSLIGNVTFSGGPEGITQVNLNANEFYVVDETNYQIRKYTHPANFSSVTMAKSWDITAAPSQMPNTGNLGPEGIAFIPDSFLNSIGFISQVTGLTYTSVKGMGGLMFVANQTGGYIYVFDINPNATNDFAYVGKYRTNRSESCDLSFDRISGLLYILHNVNGNRLESTDLSTTIIAGGERRFVLKNEYAVSNPSGTNINVEGMAITSNCTDSTDVNVWLARDVSSAELSSYKQDCLRRFNPFNAEVISSVSISASPGNVVCSGTQVTFTATPVNGGVIPLFQWKKNGIVVGSNGSSYSSNTLQSGDIVTCIMTSTEPCVANSNVSANSITMTVNSYVTPSVSISPASGNVNCSEANVTFTASPINGGFVPSYQWKKNGVNVGSNSSVYTTGVLQNNDAISCVMTSNATCVTPATATSNTLSMTVVPNVVPSVSISSNSGTSFCAGTVVTFTALPVNGGSAPSFQWKRNGVNIGTNSSTYTSGTLVNNDHITCVMTSSVNCVAPSVVTSNSIAINVNPNVIPSISISSNTSATICEAVNVTFNASITNGGSSPAYQWKINGVNAGTNSAAFSSSSLLNGDAVSCVMTSNAPCLSQNPVTSNSLVFTVEPCGFVLNLRVLIQGYYLGSGTMRAVADPVGHPLLCDTLIVELHNSTSPYNLLSSVIGTIDINGNGQFAFPNAPLNHGYYLVVRHRNSLEVWSKNPLLITSTATSYDFTTSSLMAFGNNLADLGGGYYGLWSGDVCNGAVSGLQDGIINSFDLVSIQAEAGQFLSGYLIADLDGDSMVEDADYSIVENNSAINISVLRP